MVWVGVLLLLAAHAALRWVGLFGSPSLQPMLVVSFLILIPTPWLFLKREERAALGLGRLPSLVPLAAWTAIGAGAAFTIHLLFSALYGAGPDHAYQSARATMFRGTFPDVGPWALFGLVAGPSLIFSPIGEEIFCRGTLSQLGRRFGGVVGGIVLAASVFAGLHIMHHGLIVSDRISVMGPSAALWIASMFAVSVVFSLARLRTGTVWTSVFCHAGFNLAMTGIVFTAFGVPEQ